MKVLLVGGLVIITEEKNFTIGFSPTILISSLERYIQMKITALMTQAVHQRVESVVIPFFSFIIHKEVIHGMANSNHYNYTC